MLSFLEVSRFLEVRASTMQLALFEGDGMSNMSHGLQNETVKAAHILLILLVNVGHILKFSSAYSLICLLVPSHIFHRVHLGLSKNGLHTHTQMNDIYNASYLVIKKLYPPTRWPLGHGKSSID